jgi:hypothetical protein
MATTFNSLALKYYIVRFILVLFLNENNLVFILQSVNRILVLQKNQIQLSINQINTIMKKYILIIAALFLVSFAKAQSNKEEVDLMQAAFGMDKKAVVADFVKTAEPQKAAFWKLYDEYETQRKELGKKRIELLEQYANQYETMTNEQADAWTKKAIDLQKRTDALIATYYGKIKAVTGGLVATQFYQIENYILNGIRSEILENVPFIEKKN